MQSTTQNIQENKGRAVANVMSSHASCANTGLQFTDNRPENLMQMKLRGLPGNSVRSRHFKALSGMVIKNHQARQGAELGAIQNENTSVVAQKQENNEKKNMHKKSGPFQKKENKTGLPDDLKSGIENLSNYSLDDVKVHYNSSKPALLKAHALTQGTEIHVGRGQEKHLSHEAWHTVQQKQGRVQPTTEVNGSHVNDDARLEKEADVMGKRALQMKESKHGETLIRQGKRCNNWPVSQLRTIGFEFQTMNAEVFLEKQRQLGPPVLPSKKPLKRYDSFNLELDGNDIEVVTKPIEVNPETTETETNNIKKVLSDVQSYFEGLEGNLKERSLINTETKEEVNKFMAYWLEGDEGPKTIKYELNEKEGNLVGGNYVMVQEGNSIKVDTQFTGGVKPEEFPGLLESFTEDTSSWGEYRFPAEDREKHGIEFLSQNGVDSKAGLKGLAQIATLDEGPGKGVDPKIHGMATYIAHMVVVMNESFKAGKGVYEKDWAAFLLRTDLSMVIADIAGVTGKDEESTRKANITQTLNILNATGIEADSIINLETRRDSYKLSVKKIVEDIIRDDFFDKNIYIGGSLDGPDNYEESDVKSRLQKEGETKVPLEDRPNIIGLDSSKNNEKGFWFEHRRLGFLKAQDIESVGSGAIGDYKKGVYKKKDDFMEDFEEDFEEEIEEMPGESLPIFKGKRFNGSIKDLEEAIKDLTTDFGIKDYQEKIINFIILYMPFASESLLEKYIKNILPDNKEKAGEYIAGYIIDDCI